MFRLIKQAFIGLLSFSKSITSMTNAYNPTKCISLKQCMTPFSVNLHRCA